MYSLRSFIGMKVYNTHTYTHISWSSYCMFFKAILSLKKSMIYSFINSEWLLPLAVWNCNRLLLIVLVSSSNSYQNVEFFSIHLKHCYQTPLPRKLICLPRQDTLINFPELALILLEPFSQILFNWGKGLDFESN